LRRQPTAIIVDIIILIGRSIKALRASVAGPDRVRFLGCNLFPEPSRVLLVGSFSGRVLDPGLGEVETLTLNAGETSAWPHLPGCTPEAIRLDEIEACSVAGSRGEARGT
jgi:hypothetical protein